LVDRFSSSRIDAGPAGGFADNFIFDDTWYFNITSSRWLQKKE
jgi:hypothetical protein